MDVIDGVSFGANIASLILSVLAIGISIYFYTQAKGVESKVQSALGEIKTQTNALQALALRQVDRLTKFATTPRDDSSAQTVELLTSYMRELPNIVVSLRAPAETSNEPALRRELVDTYIVLWHYTGLANIWIAAGHLPTSPEYFIESDAQHAGVKTLVDRTAGDFRYLASVVTKFDISQISASPFYSHYEEALIELTPRVGDTAEHWARTAGLSN